MRIRLHIESLVLEGLPMSSADGRAFEGAFTEELSRLLTERPLAMQTSHAMAGPVRAAAVQLAPHDTPAALARHVATAVYDALPE